MRTSLRILPEHGSDLRLVPDGLWWDQSLKLLCVFDHTQCVEGLLSLWEYERCSPLKRADWPSPSIKRRRRRNSMATTGSVSKHVKMNAVLQVVVFLFSHRAAQLKEPMRRQIRGVNMLWLALNFLKQSVGSVSWNTFISQWYNKQHDRTIKTWPRSSFSVKYGFDCQWREIWWTEGEMTAGCSGGVFLLRASAWINTDYVTGQDIFLCCIDFSCYTGLTGFQPTTCFHWTDDHVNFFSFL